MGLPGATGKYLHRKDIKEAMSYHHLKVITKQMEGKSKCDKLRNMDKRTIQSHLRFKQAQTKMCHILKPIFNFFKPIYLAYLEKNFELSLILNN